MPIESRVCCEDKAIRTMSSAEHAHNLDLSRFRKLGMQAGRDAKCDEQRGDVFQQLAVCRLQTELATDDAAIRVQIARDKRKALGLRCGPYPLRRTLCRRLTGKTIE